MPVIQVEMFPRPHEVKKAMVKEVTEAVCRTCSVPPEAVSVIIREMEPADYAVAGVLQSEIKR